MRGVILIASLVWMPLAWPVSRVGTGKVSNDENGFVMAIPPAYPSASVLPTQDLALQGRPTFHGPFTRPFLLIYLLSNLQPEWGGVTDRERFRAEYAARNWVSSAHTEACVEYWSKDNSSGRTVVMTWGNGLGVVMTAPPDQTADLNGMAESLRLENGFCSWN